MGDRGSIVAEVRAAIAPGDRRVRDWPLQIFLAALPLGIAARIWPGWGLPLGFDETFTATIASQPDLAGMLRLCLTELTGPAFYMPMWLWAKVAGTSDAALRAPVILLSIATPLMIACFGHPDRATRLLWAALTFLWLPILPTANEARPYPVLLFFVTSQAILFLRLAAAARPALAFWWGAATMLAALTNSYALIVGGCQGVALLVAHRRDMLRLWPVILPFLLVAAWNAFHLPFVLGFMARPLAYYEPDRWNMFLAAPMFVMGQGVGGYLILCLILLTRRHWQEKLRVTSQSALLIWAGVGTAIIILWAGHVGTQRYITPAIPALLFGIACWAKQVLSRDAALAKLPYVALWAAMFFELIVGSRDPHLLHRKYFEIATASDWLMQRHPKRVHFLWSSPTGWKSNDRNLAEVASFFFRREEQAAKVIVERGGTDPNGALVAASAGEHDSAILWISDITLAQAMIPRIDQIDRRWECRDFGGEGKLIYACRQRRD